ncbi:MAG: sugar transferase [Bacteroidetes bacterium]|nr:sugar transferase [Bacteroidota bacterium]
MKKQNNPGSMVYALCDWIAALVSWILFFSTRKIILEGYQWSDIRLFTHDIKFIYGLALIPLGWLLLYYVTGTYTNIYRKSRISEMLFTFFTVLSGVVIMFFVVLLDDAVRRYSDYYITLLLLFSTQFILTVFVRLLLLNKAKNEILKGHKGFRTIIIGGNARAVEVYLNITHRKETLGYIFKGFIDTNGNSTNGLAAHLNCLGKMDQLTHVIDELRIEEVIIAIESSEHPRINHIINQLVNKNVLIKIIPDAYDILSGSVRMQHIMGAAFIEIYPELMARWQYILKRFFDVFVSTVVMLLLLPLYLFIAVKVRLSSTGPILYRQVRVGLHGKPFTIYKFRSMYTDAEQAGPALSKKDDSRITPWGRIMRKWRLDELPQFYNVLIGEMSLVGPRPERQFYIDQIIARTEDYKHLQRVQPGLTSWGMVQFGYAQDIDEMIRRMKYDLIYIENMSLLLDLKILLYTVRVILQGRGK